MTCFYIIAIDGGAASGKSTIARLLAEREHLLHVDTGMHYRALTLKCIKDHVPADASALAPLLGGFSISTDISGNRALIRINDALPYDSELRSEEVNRAVSDYASLACVRNFLKNYQRSLVDLARERSFKGIVMEGRDIGTVILPDAEHKFFFFADEATRAHRRNQEGIRDSITYRDKIDSTRKNAPLACPDDAVRVDTSSMPIDEVYELVSNSLSKDNG